MNNAQRPVAYFQRNKISKQHFFIYKKRVTIHILREEKIYWNEIVHALNAYGRLCNIAKAAEIYVENKKNDTLDIDALHEIVSALIELKKEHTFIGVQKNEAIWQPRCSCAEAIEGPDELL